VTLEAESARLDPARAAVVEQDSFASKQGVSLKDGQTTNVGNPATAPDLVFPFAAAQPGRYLIRSHAAVDAKGTDAMRRARGKQDSLYLMLAIGDGRPTQRVVFVPWSKPQSCVQTLGIFGFTGEEQEIRVWLPEGTRLDYLQVIPYVPPKVPDAVVAYQPTVVPPATRPRIWLNEASLPQIRANLERGENARQWERLLERAEKPFAFTVAPNAEVGYNSALESAAVAKAFVCLMTGEEAHGREAIRLTREYLAAVEFGNLLDITREIGRAIYSASLVYDWCYDLMTPEDRDIIRANLMRLADDMEIGWPPFRQIVVNGHGNEAQVNRDLLAMGIAIYDEDPVPYQYCAHRILEDLVPMRRFEYQSPRHNQGVSYGPYRYGWDLHSAWLFRRMTGQKAFDDNLTGVYYQWLYMRVPNHRMLRDGDGFSDGRPANLGLTPLLNYAYSNDPIVKWDFIRQGGMDSDPLMILLLNNPDLEPAPGLESLPLTKDFGPVLGSMIARTGWNMGRNAGDVVVEMKGGGYNFGNHQHADAGSFQIYYRGLQAVDLGQYRFYGTPYDSNFCKRSVPHSMLLVVDPEETFRGTTTNDGGTRSVRSCPQTPEQATSDPLFANGGILSSSFGPNPQRPFFSHFAVDLKSAYSDKIENYVRSFCFLNLDNEQTPAVLIVLDVLTTAKPEFRKYWQVNTLNPPEQTADGVILRNGDLGLRGKVDLRMLLPKPDERTLEILSGPDANSVFGTRFEAPFPDRPEANGHRLLFSPKENRTREAFLTVMTMADEAAPELPVSLAETETAYVLSLADRVVVLSRTGTLIDKAFAIEVAPGGNRQLLLTGLAPGAWSVTGGPIACNVRVEAGKHTAFAVVPGGSYRIQPQAIPGALDTPDFMPRPTASLSDRVFIAGNMLPEVQVQLLDGQRFLPAKPVGEALGLTVTETARELRLTGGNRAAVFHAGSNQIALNDLPFAIPVPARLENGVWLLPDTMLAILAGRSLVRDESDSSVEFSAEPRPWPQEVLWIEASRESDPLALHALLADIPGRTEYWAAEGQDVHVDLTLRQTTPIKGVGIQWHQGNRRQAKFAIETSMDGITWQRVFEGTSSGKTTDLETYEFAPCQARRLRFVGFGNSANQWNSLVHFRLLTDAE
jgi:heparin/heparan-sulfate lyase